MYFIIIDITNILNEKTFISDIGSPDLSFFTLPSSAQQRKKVGVVLSGGGAKGVAHIGALKVIEEAGIPIDYIVGTSMDLLSEDYTLSAIPPSNWTAW